MFAKLLMPGLATGTVLAVAGCFQVTATDARGNTAYTANGTGFLILRDPHAEIGQDVYINRRAVPIIRFRDEEGRPTGDWFIRNGGQTHRCAGNEVALCQVTASQIAREENAGGNENH